MEKIRLFALAKELGIDNKALMDYCQKLGIVVKPSPLAGISPEERDRVVELIKKGAAKPAAAPAEVVTRAEAIAPVREPVVKVPMTKVPAIKSPARPASRDTTEEIESADVAAEIVEPAASVTPAPVDVAAVAPKTIVAPAGKDVTATPATVVRAEPAVTEPAPAAKASIEKADAVSPVAAKAGAGATATVSTGAVAASSATPVVEPEVAIEPAATPIVVEGSAPSPVAGALERPPSPRVLSPMAPREMRSIGSNSRNDYISPSGSSRERPMNAKETPPKEDGGDKAAGAKKGKARPGPVLPTLMTPPPSLKSPGAPTKSEGPAQKPEIRFTAENLANAKGKPLQAALAQSLEERKRKKKLEEGTDGTEESRKKGFGAKGPTSVGSGLTDVRKDRQAKRGKSGRPEDEEEGGDAAARRRARARARGKSAGNTALKTEAEIEFPITIRSLSEAIGRPAANILRILMQRGQMLTVNSSLDESTAIEVCLELGVDLSVKQEQDVEEMLVELTEAEGGNRVTRAPIVTIMGHVDHGKTTLLDKIRSANVAAGEVGGITQHIAAYQVVHNGRPITFLDTPGHAAFAEMRARGANVTDIAVLVVAANDSVMPQTIEALNHARAAEVPIVVAMNKVDLPDRNEQRVLQDLATQNLLAAEWGGDTEVVRTSGASGAGIEDLLETLLTIADLNEWTADPDRDAFGVCLEAFRDEGRGAIAWLVIQDGTLRKGDVVLCGQTFGRIRGIYNDRDEEIEEAGPSTPVKVSGLDAVPGAGDKFYVLDDVEEAREIAETRRVRGREIELSQKAGRPQTMEEILSVARGEGVRELAVILKADTPGSLEALKGELAKFDHPEVRVQVLHTGVGGVNESDVYLASASGAIVVAFHVVPEDRAETLAEREGVEIRQYGIIYEVTDDMKKALEGLLRPERIEQVTGRALVLQTFSISRVGTIAGCRVLNGTIERNSRIRVIRDQRVMNDYDISSLKRVKDDVKEVREGQECGIRLERFDDLKEGDIFQAIKIQEVKRTL